MFNFYITKSASNFGMPSTRPIYEQAIDVLPDAEVVDMCLKFADMEKRLGEIDRSRAIFAHASQFCDPRTHRDFWQRWHEFEVQHGNEDTFKEMLRIKRSVQAKFNTDVNFIASQALAKQQQQQQASAQGVEDTEGGAEAGQDPEVMDAMAALERQARAPVGFVAASDGPRPGNVPVEPVVTANPDAIDIDDMDE